MKPTGSPDSSTMGAAEMFFSTNRRMASSTVASLESENTSVFMMDVSSDLRVPPSSTASSSPGLSFTSAMVITRPMRHKSVHTRKAALMPNMVPWAAPNSGVVKLCTWVDTAMMIAVPSEPATWRSVLFTEVPWFMTLLSRAFMPQVVMGMFTSDIENMRTVYTMVM